MVSGTAENPIYIRGQSQADTIIETNLNRGFSYVTGSHIVFENLTLDGGYSVDYSMADDGYTGWGFVLGNSGNHAENITIRNCTIRNFPTAIVTAGVWWQLRT